MTSFQITPQEVKSTRAMPFRSAGFYWQHRRPVRDLTRSDQPIIDSGPTLSEGYKELDLVNNAGLDWISSQMAGQASGLSAVIALGTGSAAPTMGDITLGGEITGSGLTRTTGTTSGIGALVGLATGGATIQTTGSFAIGNTFTSSGTVTVNEIGLGQSVIYNAGVVARDLVSPAAGMAPGDTLFGQYQVIL